MADHVSILIEGLKISGLDASPEKIRRFGIYLKALLGLPCNLTSIRDGKQVVIRHFLDSVCILKYFSFPAEERMADIGPGAGFPLLPVKILRPELDCVFIDSKRKSTEFIEKTAEKLALSDVRTVTGQAREVVRKRPELRFDRVLVRALGDAAYDIRHCLGFLENSGRLYLYKGPAYKREISRIPRSLAEKADILCVQPVRVPFLDEERYIIEIGRKGAG